MLPPTTSSSSRSKTQQFVYAPHTEKDIKAMLEVIGAKSLEALSSLPPGLKIEKALDIAPALPEADATGG